MSTSEKSEKDGSSKRQKASRAVGYIYLLHNLARIRDRSNLSDCSYVTCIQKHMETRYTCNVCVYVRHAVTEIPRTSLALKSGLQISY